MTQISKDQISISYSCALLGGMGELHTARKRKGSWGHQWCTERKRTKTHTKNENKIN